MRNKPVDATCVICGATFSVHLCHIDQRSTCSRECRRIMLRRRRQNEIEQQFNKPIRSLLYDLYYRDEIGVKKIAKMIGVSDHNLWLWFGDLGIPLRERTDAVAIQWKDNKERRQKSAKQMGEMSRAYYSSGGITPSKRRDVAKKISEAKMGAKNAMYGRFGASHPGWLGGKITYRGAGWIGVREQAKRRDGYKCRRCGSGDSLQVHHIVPYRDTQDNSLDNLVTLCVSCHMAVEHQGATWT